MSFVLEFKNFKNIKKSENEFKSEKNKIEKLIAPAFKKVFEDLVKEKHTHYWLKGGRGSTKSSFISIQIINGIMADKNANCVALRKVGQNLKDSVYEQLQWAISALGVDNLWQGKVSPLELIYIPTGQRIIFRGADKPKKIKSTKFRKGYCKYLWYEEVDEFNGMSEIRTINQSLMRGGDKFVVFYSFNPPKSQRNWTNIEMTEEREDKLVHHSTYLGVPKEWLGEQFIVEAEHLKNVNYESYAHEYLGEVTGTGGEVFTNITIRTISDEEIRMFDRIARGIDWGYASDPFTYTVNHYDRKRRRLYIFYEIYKVGLSNKKAYELIKQENKNNKIVVCDSAEPKSIAEMNSYGLRVIGAKKGPDSVEYGIKWLQDLEEIVIDPVRCPNTTREFNGYELEKDKYGEFKADFPDKNNHTIDAVRYSRESDMRSIKIR
ncbi:terminase [Tyzzerella sp. An114]|uniref:PBSX family phage terminase large subunit n=1 Tax=Tyzzerella sp. An114 TaxID=1965545 RepID=UPI000B4335CD|nr:PBSX family phage terminase large subunit [Tyzzerella sp. An114]OUQ56343.1 terminase [Tyzzerella sp. An114]HIT73664.1 PBSX family phage terminase large subunit [Candidatus Fimicola cottocaccae]